MSESNDVKESIRRLLTNNSLAVLSTYDSGRNRPHASVVGFAVSKDLREVVFATPVNTRKFGCLRETPDVALLVDDRDGKPSDFHAASAVTIYGEAEIVSDSSNLKSTYVNKFPHLEEFAHSPSCAFIRVRVKSFSLVHRFQDVTELIVS